MSQYTAETYGSACTAVPRSALPMAMPVVRDPETTRWWGSGQRGADKFVGLDTEVAERLWALGARVYLYQVGGGPGSWRAKCRRGGQPEMAPLGSVVAEVLGWPEEERWVRHRNGDHLDHRAHNLRPRNAPPLQALPGTAVIDVYDPETDEGQAIQVVTDRGRHAARVVASEVWPWGTWVLFRGGGRRLGLDTWRVQVEDWQIAMVRRLDGWHPVNGHVVLELDDVDPYQLGPADVSGEGVWVGVVVSGGRYEGQRVVVTQPSGRYLRLSKRQVVVMESTIMGTVEGEA